MPALTTDMLNVYKALEQAIKDSGVTLETKGEDGKTLSNKELEEISKAIDSSIKKGNYTPRNHFFYPNAINIYKGVIMIEKKIVPRMIGKILYG